ncbi:MAG: hypothetical protein QOF98_2839 [Streptomyces sp.]|nr:hypothetical protein [Streptomyces sp.]
MYSYRRVSLLSAIAVAGLATTLAVTPAFAATAPLSQPKVLAHFDITTGQQPENIAVEPNGSADLTFNAARQVAHVSPNGAVSILATLPASSTGTAEATGIVRASDGTLYVNYLAGTASGVYKLRPGGAPVLFAALPEVGFLNGLTLDERTGTLYATDSAKGAVWKVALKTGQASLWATADELAPGTGPTAFGFGSNGIKVHDGAVWVSNTDRGTLSRIPIRANGTAGTLTTEVTGAVGIDDFAFIGEGDTVLAALNFESQVILVQPGGTPTTVLTSADGLSNPTSIGLWGKTVYVPSAAYFTQQDPNLLEAQLGC